MRQTRCAMEFECQFEMGWRDGSEQRTAKVPLGCLRDLDARELASRKESCFRWGGCVGVRERMLASRLMDDVRRNEVHAY